MPTSEQLVRGLVGEPMLAKTKRAVAICFVNSARSLRIQIDRRFGRLDRELAERYIMQSKAPKLHIGCGAHTLSGWLNTDYDPSTLAVMYLDATKVFPFPEETFDYVFSEHMIEHVSYKAGLHMLAECHRVLKPYGTLRISTPDLAFLIDIAASRQIQIVTRLYKNLVQHLWSRRDGRREPYLPH
jgi:SAM-dependent methyltransferase